MKPSKDFLAELEALLRKHGVELIGADYHDAVLIIEKEWSNKDRLLVDGDSIIATEGPRA